MAWQVSEGILQDPDFPGTRSFFHGVTTRSLGNRKEATDGWRPEGVTTVILGEQVHGARIAWVGECLPQVPVSGTDGFITTRPCLALGIFVADCAPVFIAWPERGVVGVLHAGWRGLARGIVREACRSLIQQVGKEGWEDLRVAIGPHMKGCCYRVGWDVARCFPGSSAVKNKESSWSLDLGTEIRSQLRDFGVSPDSISEAPFCTMEDQRLFSHRRDQDGRRMLAYIFRQ